MWKLILINLEEKNWRWGRKWLVGKYVVLSWIRYVKDLNRRLFIESCWDVRKNGYNLLNCL